MAKPARALKSDEVEEKRDADGWPNDGAGLNRPSGQQQKGRARHFGGLLIYGAASVAIVCGSCLVALRWVIAHRERKFEHAPLVEMQKKLDELEGRLMAGALRR